MHIIIQTDQHNIIIIPSYLALNAFFPKIWSFREIPTKLIDYKNNTTPGP